MLEVALVGATVDVELVVREAVQAMRVVMVVLDVQAAQWIEGGYGRVHGWIHVVG